MWRGDFQRGSPNAQDSQPQTSNRNNNHKRHLNHQENTRKSPAVTKSYQFVFSSVTQTFIARLNKMFILAETASECFGEHS